MGVPIVNNNEAEYYDISLMVYSRIYSSNGIEYEKTQLSMVPCLSNYSN